MFCGSHFLMCMVWILPARAVASQSLVETIVDAGNNLQKNERSFIFVAVMRPKDENKELAVREAALEMIVKEGFKGMSMQKLAKKAKVSPATLYLYFENREDLLNKLYLEVRNRSHEAALKNFDPEMNFAEGLKLLWLNRYRYFIKHPLDFFFIEQFISSPLVAAAAQMEDTAYKLPLQKFAKNAFSRGEIVDVTFEVYWPIAFAPLYQMLRFQLQPNMHFLKQPVITEAKVLRVLELVLRALVK